ncbi:MAG: DUF3667 domain-containing protein [Pedobacter sp.]|nr:MAG: DUF3667 domain-containing protein [Pedobacter sp.]
MAEISVNENICKNCNHTFTRHYCNECGQKKSHRITTAHLSHDLIHAIFHADKGIFTYLKRLLYQPGVIAREYIDGKRKIFNPIQFLVLSVGLLISVMFMVKFFDQLKLIQNQSMKDNAPVASAAQQAVSGFIQRNGNILQLVLIPVFASFSGLIFRKKANNYAEHLMLIVFAMSLSNILTALAASIIYFAHLNLLVLISITPVFTLTSFFLTYKQFYRSSIFEALWKAVIIYLLGFCVFISLTVLLLKLL